MNQIPDMYHVKFTTSLGVLHYGTIDHYSPEALCQIQSNRVIFEDAIENLNCVVPLADITEVEHDEFYEFLKAEHDKALAISNAAGKGLAVGKVFNCQVADGHASYVIVKVYKATVKIAWRGYGNPDRYTYGAFGYGGNFPKSQIEGFVDWADNWAEIVAKSKTTATAG